MENCTWCSGSGTVQCDCMGHDSDCSRCGGMGSHPCSSCGGSGQK